MSIAISPKRIPLLTSDRKLNSSVEKTYPNLLHPQPSLVLRIQVPKVRLNPKRKKLNINVILTIASQLPPSREPMPLSPNYISAIFE